MARKTKIPRKYFHKYEREGYARKTDFRNKRKYYLIICEGEKTEPNYFEGLKNDLPKGVLTYYRIDIEGLGINTLSLIEEAQQRKETYEKEYNRPVDKLWVVFDKDSFPSQNFNAAITNCRNSNPEIGCAWSNEAFELWYLLHFHFYNTATARNDYQRMIENNLKPHIGNDYRYRKNSLDMYDILKDYGSVDDAIRNAKRLVANFEGRNDYSNQNPCTMVWRLVEELMELQ